MTNDNIVVNSAQVGTNLCVEKWVYSSTAVGCVKLQGSISRLFKTTDTFNTAAVATNIQDLTLDYVTYQTYASFGQLTVAAQTFPFTATAVNYDTFNQVNLGALHSLVGLSMASIIAIASLVW